MNEARIRGKSEFFEEIGYALLLWKLSSHGYISNSNQPIMN